jgi:DNA-binding GntR family transcriptional regulator
MPELRPIERPESLTERAVKRLREAIVSGDFELGQPLSERQLAQMLEISKTPVREALAQLRREGLVRILPQRGASVFTLSQQEVVEICELRQALEAAALKAAMERNPRRFAEALATSVQRMTKARARHDIKAYLTEDTAFHLAFFAHCGNALMAHNYDLFVGKIAALRTHLAHKPQHTELSFREHESMRDAVARGDGAEALAILDVHIARTKQTYSEGVTDIAAADSPARRTGT